MNQTVETQAAIERIDVTLFYDHSVLQSSATEAASNRGTSEHGLRAFERFTEWKSGKIREL